MIGIETPKLDKALRLRRIRDAHERLQVVTLEDERDRTAEDFIDSESEGWIEEAISS